MMKIQTAGILRAAIVKSHIALRSTVNASKVELNELVFVNARIARIERIMIYIWKMMRSKKKTSR